MSEAEEIETGEKVFPIFFKKKVLPLKKTKQLLEVAKELMQENDELIENEKLMLNKIREKHNEFLSKLEGHLEAFKTAGIEKIKLEPDNLPVWLHENESKESVDDTYKRLEAWYETMTTCVNLQYAAVENIFSDWFTQMEKIESEGEPEPQGADGLDFAAEKSIDFQKFWANISWYIFFVIICVINMFIFFLPEEVDQCVDDGFHKCFARNMMKISVFLYDQYLRFHNITLDYQTLNNSSDPTVQCALGTEL